MSNIQLNETPPLYDDYDEMMAELRKIAAEKPTLQMINATESRLIEEWEQAYPELWLLIAVTREDIHGVYEGRLLATAASSVEFLDLGKDCHAQGVVTLTTRGVALGPQPICVPTSVAVEGHDYLPA